MSDCKKSNLFSIPVLQQPNVPLLDDQFVDMKFITSFTTLSDKWFYKQIQDKKFPKPIKFGRKSLWLKSEVEYWAMQKILASRGGMNAAFAQLRNNMRFNRLFEHYITYAAKLEYGVDRRWHYHVVFFYDGQKVKNDYLLAQALGKYWVDTITRGLGSYYSANMNSDKYKAFALGMIDYSELGRIENLKVVLDYLVKEEVVSTSLN